MIRISSKILIFFLERTSCPSEGSRQREPLSPLLSTILLDELKELFLFGYQP